MDEDVKHDVNANSVEFKQGVEAGLNSEQDTMNWKAGNELGQELKEEAEPEARVSANPFGQASTPLFLRDGPEGRKGNAQDEKDEAVE